MLLFHMLHCGFPSELNFSFDGGVGLFACKLPLFILFSVQAKFEF